MSRSILGLVALPFVFSPCAAHAQEAAPIAPPTLPGAPTGVPPTAPEPEIALDELMARAQANNPAPRIAAANLEAAQERAGALRSLPNPVLQAVPGVGGSNNSRNEELILSQSLDLFGQRRAQRATLNAQARQAQAEADLASRTLIIEVKNAAAGLFAAQEAESLGASQVQIAAAFRDAAARKAALGDAPAVQAQRAQLELDRAQNDLDSARAERLARRATLNQIIGQAPESPLRVQLPDSSALRDLTRLNALSNILPGAIPSTGAAIPPSTAPNLPVPTAPGAASNTPVLGASSQVGSDLVASRAQFLPQALATRPDVVGAQAALDARRAAVDAIGRSRYPQIEIQARRDGVAYAASGTSLRAVITVPIFDFGSIKRQQRAARADVRAQEEQITLLKSQVAAQVESALVRLGQQRTTVARYRTAIVPQTLDLLRKTQIGYLAGASTYLEVLEAQRATRQVQTEYLQALVGVRTSEASLESAFGASLPPMPSGALENPSGAARPDGVAAPGILPSGVIPPVGTPPPAISPSGAPTLSPPPVNAPPFPASSLEPGVPGGAPR